MQPEPVTLSFPGFPPSCTTVFFPESTLVPLDKYNLKVPYRPRYLKTNSFHKNYMTMNHCAVFKVQGTFINYAVNFSIFMSFPFSHRLGFAIIIEVPNSDVLDFDNYKPENHVYTCKKIAKIDIKIDKNDRFDKINKTNLSCW